MCTHATSQELTGLHLVQYSRHEICPAGQAEIKVGGEALKAGNLVPTTLKDVDRAGAVCPTIAREKVALATTYALTGASGACAFCLQES